jgi:hypothetical protein
MRKSEIQDAIMFLSRLVVGRMEEDRLFAVIAALQRQLKGEEGEQQSSRR